VHRVRSVLSVYEGLCNLRIGLSGWTKFACAVALRSEARSGNPCVRFKATLPQDHLLFIRCSRSSLLLRCLASKPMRVAQWLLQRWSLRLNRLIVPSVLRRGRSHILHDLTRVNAFDCRCRTYRRWRCLSRPTSLTLLSSREAARKGGLQGSAGDHIEHDGGDHLHDG
jgi:hypothetical protein